MSTSPNPNIQDFQYRSHEQFLNGITTFIDFDIDLKLYSINRAFSNDFMSLVGIHILDKGLQVLFDNCKYMIRCYHQGQKFFEMLLGKDYNLKTHFVRKRASSSGCP